MRRRLTVVASLILIIGAGVATSTFHTSSSAPQDKRSYIVQAQTLDAAKALAIDVGGEITHELGIINSVGARLSLPQVNTLRGMTGVRRIYEDSSVSVNNSVLNAPGCTLEADANLTFGYDDFSWTVKNSGGTDIHLEKAMILWPASNDRLEMVDFGSARIFYGRRVGISAAFTLKGATDSDDDSDDEEDDEEDDDDRAFRIRPGGQQTLRVDFRNVRREQRNYEVRLFFEESCSIGFPLPEQVKFKGDSDTEAQRTYVASLTGADALHWEGVTGNDIGVAIVDTGIWANGGKSQYLKNNSNKASRIVAHYDAIAGQELGVSASSDNNGHGSHVASILASSRHKDSEFNGIAPDANLIIVKAFDDVGMGTYTNVIRALDWVVKNRDAHQIRVLNLSFSAEPRSYYWDDPLNQAVMAAWGAGIVVVTAAGNGGPEPMTIGVPGNVPYVITVGAMTDSVTPMDWTDDTLASFSAAGPTVEAFVKPDLVAPGGHLRGMLGQTNKIAIEHPHFHDGDAYYTMSGTSQSAAVVSGIATLILDSQPWLTPDQIKCKLMGSARPALDKTGALAYSIFQQGAGMVDALGALKANASLCANVGLDIHADLTGTTHYQGRADQDASGNYVIRDTSGYTWDGSYSLTDGYVWTGGMLWNDGILWSRGMLWNDSVLWSNGMLWNDGIDTAGNKLSSNGMLWNDGQPVAIDINVWVEQE